MTTLEVEEGVGAGPSYYGLGSTARRESCELDGRAKESCSYINDDLADEVEAIRLAADFSSRKLLSEQRRDRRDSLAVTPASASRMRIRAILDKQKTLKVISPAGASISTAELIFYLSRRTRKNPDGKKENLKIFLNSSGFTDRE